MSVLYFQVFLIISGKNLIDIHRQKSTLQEMATVRNLFGYSFCIKSTCKLSIAIL